MVMMLHVFNVDIGKMLVFDIIMSAELVSVLQEHIYEVTKIPIKKQVLLVSGGIELSPSHRVAAFGAGTDTNPIFLYNKQYYHHPGNVVPLDLMVLEDGPEWLDLQEEVNESLGVPDSMNTLVLRALLALRFSDMAQVALQSCQRLLHEQRLQHQGFMLAIANMSLTVPGAKSKTEKFLSTLQEFLNSKPHYLHLIETVQEVEATLANIPVLPSLVERVPQDPMTSITSCKNIEEQRDNMSLLDWLQLRSSDDSFHQLSQICMRDMQQFTEEMVTSIQTSLTKMVISFVDKNMRTIKGLPERFLTLEKVLNTLSSVVQEQRDLAEAMDKNSREANMLGDNSILPDLSVSHRHQLIMMQRNHKKIKEFQMRVEHAKRELIKILNLRLKWTYNVQCQMSALLEITHMSSSGLKTLTDKLWLLQQIHSVPELYLTAVKEVVRRRAFSQTFLQWANDLSCQLQTVHSEEVARRQNFQTQFEGHILSNLFPGMGDVPPPFATQAPESFDTKLPKLEVHDIEVLREEMAQDSAPPVTLPDLKAITQFFESNSISNRKKPKEVECLVEDAENRADCKQGQKVSQLDQAKEEVQESIVTIRNNLSSMKEWLQSEHNHVHSFLQQLTIAYQSEVDLKDQHIYQLEEEVDSQEEEIEELKEQLARSLEAETREREQREQVEAERDTAVCEVTEKLLLDHNKEMAAAHSRFRLIATAASVTVAFLSSAWTGWIIEE